MSWLLAKIYDSSMRRSEEACLGEWRAQLLADLSGHVLEVGAGTGINLQHYPELDRLVLSEPDPHMRRLLEQRADSADRSVEVRAHGVETIGEPDRTFDAVVATLVLCSVPDVARALGEIQRVLKPGGRFVFLEHVAAPEGSSRRAWQRRVEPVWKWCVDGCHLTRDTQAFIEDAGFELETLQRESMRRALPVVRPTIRGIARRTS